MTSESTLPVYVHRRSRHKVQSCFATGCFLAAYPFSSLNTLEHRCIRKSDATTCVSIPDQHYHSIRLLNNSNRITTLFPAGISRDSRHKRRETGGKRAKFRKKRKFEMGRPGANTKLGHKRVHPVRCRGGNMKYRALRLDTGNFSWGTEGKQPDTQVCLIPSSRPGANGQKLRASSNSFWRPYS